MAIEADLTVFFADFGVDVTVGADTTKGLKDAELEQVLRGTSVGDVVLGERETVLVETGSLSGLAQGAAITVDGNARTVGSHGLLEDGKLTLIELRG